jgi:hypothetical protein
MYLHFGNCPSYQYQAKKTMTASPRQLTQLPSSVRPEDTGRSSFRNVIDFSSQTLAKSKISVTTVSLQASLYQKYYRKNVVNLK